MFITISKGIDLQIAGAADPSSSPIYIAPKSIAIIPDDFHGFIPKADVKEGDTVSIGAPLLHDKRDERIKIVAPCSGVVSQIARGERRHIERIVITPGATDNAVDLRLQPSADSDTIRQWLMQSGLWAFMRQRPFDIVPEPDIVIRDIFVTGFDSAPLAITPSLDADAAAQGVALLKKLTDGNIYISRRNHSATPDIAGAIMVDVAGPHPAGNVGTIIANIAPINKGEVLLTLDFQTLCRIGATAISGKFNAKTQIAVVGPMVKNPCLVETIIGCDIESILAKNIKDTGKHLRIISGNVLTGIKTEPDSYIHFPYRQLTVIAEGDDKDDFMGWISISPKRMSDSAAYPLSKIAKWLKRPFSPDARLMGGRRALIMSEEYDRYMPMDILPEYLLKAILSHNIEQMEQLGIYEVAPEDFALGEWADTSKLEAQKIVRQGLDYLYKELK